MFVNNLMVYKYFFPQIKTCHERPVQYSECIMCLVFDQLGSEVLDSAII